MKRLNIVVLVLIMFFSSITLLAHHHKKGQMPNHKKVFSKLDKNNDGKISKKEAKHCVHKCLSKNFENFDVNKNGYIEKSEFINKDCRKFKMMKEADTNNDGKISIDEMLALKKKHLIKADKNKNGFLEPEELDEMKKHNKWKHNKCSCDKKNRKSCSK